jgi:hypothetical protein
MIIYLIGFTVYMVTFIGFSAQDAHQMSSSFPVGIFISMFVLYGSMFISIFLMILAALILPTAISHMVATGKFSGGFDFAGWWKVIRANLWGYLLGMIVLYGVIMAAMLVFQMLYVGMFVCCLVIFVGIAAMTYPLVVVPALMSYMYRAGQEKLEAAG